MKANEYPRRIDWNQRLHAYVISVRDKEFEYGVHDCCTFAAGCVEAVLGIDPMAEFREQYHSLEQGNEALQTIGDGDLFRTLHKVLGPSLPGAGGHKGDVAFFDCACGIVIGRVAMFISEKGYSVVLLSKLQRIFRVGNGEVTSG